MSTGAVLAGGGTTADARPVAKQLALPAQTLSKSAKNAIGPGVAADPVSRLLVEVVVFVGLEVERMGLAMARACSMKTIAKLESGVKVLLPILLTRHK